MQSALLDQMLDGARTELEYLLPAILPPPGAAGGSAAAAAAAAGLPAED